MFTYSPQRAEDGISYDPAKVIDEVHGCGEGVHGAADDVAQTFLLLPRTVRQL